ncbi:MAG: hypothetical protein IPN38_11720 [Flavobacteriales bacterium]|nr:hypothetical protein [Flavobacteriales bacterium]
MRSPFHLPVVLLALLTVIGPVAAQPDTLILAHDDLQALPDAMEDPVAVLDGYEPLNATLGGDSVRNCKGYGCSGWVEDHYPGVSSSTGAFTMKVNW